VTITFHGGYDGSTEGYSVDGDGNVLQLCEGFPKASGHITPDAVRAFVAELKASHVFDPTGAWVVNNSNCSDGLIQDISLDDDTGSSSASVIACDSTAAGDRVRAIVDRAYKVFGQPPGCH
jgi:hypothetical protein